MENILGIEFLGNKIKILEVCATEKGWQVLRLDKLDLPLESIKEGVLIEPKLIADKIVSFIRENNILAKKVIGLIGPPYIFTRLISLPYNLSDEQIYINLEAEINQYQFFSGKENVISFKRIEEISEEGLKKINTLFVTISKAITESYLKTLELAGLDLVGIDAPIFSIMRLLENVDFNPFSLDAVLLLLIGQNYLDVCIMKGNRPRFLHSTDIDIGNFESGRENFLDKIVSAIKLVINFYETRFMQGEKINRIIVNSLLEGYGAIDTLLQKRLPQAVIQISNPLNKFYVEDGQNLNLDELKFSFSGILGAILRLENKKQPFSLNLLLEQKAQMQGRFKQIQVLLISFSAVLFIAIIFYISFVFRISMLQQKISLLTSKIKQPSLELKWALFVKGKRDLLVKQSEDASEIINSVKRQDCFKFIAKGMLLAPAGLWLRRIAFDQGNKYLFLNGLSLTEKSIFVYISSLSGSGYFNSVEIASSKNELDKINFSIKCAIK